MTNTIESVQQIELIGKSGERYTGEIYTDKNSTSTITGPAIVILTNSSQTENGWTHHVNSIYNTDNVLNELEHFKSRDDISHLILLSYSRNENGVADKVDDLIRKYIHG